jgi:hypothetical protein
VPSKLTVFFTIEPFAPMLTADVGQLEVHEIVRPSRSRFAPEFRMMPLAPLQLISSQSETFEVHVALQQLSWVPTMQLEGVHCANALSASRVEQIAADTNIRVGSMRPPGFPPFHVALTFLAARAAQLTSHHALDVREQVSGVA